MLVTWLPAAEKDLHGLDRTHVRRVLDAFERYVDTGVGDVKKLQDVNAYRLRVGDYRVIFEVNGDSLVVLRIRHRREAYR